MNLLVDRRYKKDTYTIGKLYIDGQYFCDTLEDTVRDLHGTDGRAKIHGETAIPEGTYEITLNIVSPKFSKYPFYQKVCNGRVPRLLNVPYFEGILLHVADGPKGDKLVQGCIGVGKNRIKGGLLEGRDTFIKLYSILKSSKDKIYITIR